MQTEKAQQKSIHIFVTKGQEHIRIEFETETVTGLDIKTKAGGGTADGLFHRVDGKVVEIGDEEPVKLKNGMQFTLVPNGTVS